MVGYKEFLRYLEAVLRKTNTSDICITGEMSEEAEIIYSVLKAFINVATKEKDNPIIKEVSKILEKYKDPERLFNISKAKEDRIFNIGYELYEILEEYNGSN